ncbi:MAG: hypothetical protein ACRCYV_08805 [Aeromonas sp.]
MQQLERAGLQNGLRLQLDFSSVTQVRAEGALLLFALITRVHLEQGKKALHFCWPCATSNPNGYACVVQTGLASALECRTNQALREAKGFYRSYKLSSPTKLAAVDTNIIARTARDLIANVRGSGALNNDQELVLEQAIGEAILNIHHHAYAAHCFSDLVKAIGRRWWQCAWKDDRTVTFLIYDIGIGIYGSYTGLEYIHPSHCADEKAILLQALEPGHSRFNRAGEQPSLSSSQNRGFGSDNIKSPVSLSSENIRTSLRIFSRKTIYRYDSGDAAPECIEIPEFLYGTLIVWRIENPTLDTR